MDSQYNNLKYRKNDREIHSKWVVTPFINASACIFAGSISESNFLQGYYSSW